MTKKAKAKQLRVPGTERTDRVEEIETSAIDYVNARDERMALTEAEAEKQAALVTAMKAAKKVTYRCDDVDLIVELSSLEKAKVRRVAEKVEEA